MSDIQVIPYDTTYEAAWDAFVTESRNGTFLHSRAFIDYHADRLVDCSAIIVSENAIIGLFPASVGGAAVISHSGLTFGGLVYGIMQRASLVHEMLEALVNHYRSAQFKKLIYKAVPHVFHAYPSEDDLHALFRMNAKLIRRDLSAVIPPSGSLKISSLRKRGHKKAEKNFITVREGGFYPSFHALLKCALERHGTEPVHSLADFELLRQRVPANIKLIGAFDGEELVAGTWLFLFDNVVHTQYLASSDRGFEVGALDMLLFHVLGMAEAKGLYVSFGSSSENGGMVLNSGLMAQKEGFGARGMILDQYELEI